MKLGKETDVLKGVKSLSADLFFSLITTERTLDFETVSRADRDTLAEGFSILINKMPHEVGNDSQGPVLDESQAIPTAEGLPSDITPGVTIDIRPGEKSIGPAFLYQLHPEPYHESVTT